VNFLISYLNKIELNLSLLFSLSVFSFFIFFNPMSTRDKDISLYISGCKLHLMSQFHKVELDLFLLYILYEIIFWTYFFLDENNYHFLNISMVTTLISAKNKREFVDGSITKPTKQIFCIFLGTTAITWLYLGFSTLSQLLINKVCYGWTMLEIF